MSRGGKRPGQRGREKVDPALHYQRRYFSLPPDVIEGLEAIPNGERSRLVATLLREYFSGLEKVKKELRD